MWNIEYPVARAQERLPDSIRIEKGEDKVIAFCFPGDDAEARLPCFIILFELEFDREKYPKDKTQMMRVIRCADMLRATYIANEAMLGEEISQGKLLVKILKIVEIGCVSKFIFVSRFVETFV